MTLLVEAINRTGGTDAVKVAYALEDMRIQGGLGEVWMRPDDHQLFERLYILSVAALDGKEVIYDLEGAGIGARTEARIEAKDMIRPTACKMQRPPRP